MQEDRFTDKAALVTGAASGIRRSTALRLAEEWTPTSGRYTLNNESSAGSWLYGLHRSPRFTQQFHGVVPSMGHNERPDIYTAYERNDTVYSAGRGANVIQAIVIIRQI